jgi:hypothetical protein
MKKIEITELDYNWKRKRKIELYQTKSWKTRKKVTYELKPESEKEIKKLLNKIDVFYNLYLKNELN